MRCVGWCAGACLVVGASLALIGIVRADEATVALPEVDVDVDPAVAAKAKHDSFDAARDTIFPTAAATAAKIDRDAIDRQPQGADTPFDTLLTQLPGVSADSAASRPDIHVRNEYSNVQYRINGILLPDSVSGLGPVLDTSFIGTLALLDGALPAQYGLRTAGVIDITSRSFGAPQGSVSIYGGSHGVISPRFDYGGVSGSTQYFVALRGFQSDVGIENPTPSYDPVHDRTDQGKAFGYLSTVLSDSARISVMAGVSASEFQIPNVPGRVPRGDFGGDQLNSLGLNEHETSQYAFVLAALQTTSQNLDSQLSIYSRYAQEHFIPDVFGGLAFNDVASDVSRKSVLNGVNEDAAYRLDERQTIRAGVGFSAEQTHNDNLLTALPLGADGTPLPTPVTFVDNQAKLGINVGGYVQDEFKLTPTLTVIGGLRFDQLYQYVTANQLSPRLGVVWQVDSATTLRAGYARYFTPPSQSEAATANIALARGTTLAAEVPLADPTRPERSHYFDIGADRTVLPGLDVGADLYLKLATNYIDDGEFGDAQVLSQVNYAKAYGEGFEFKVRYRNEGFSAYGNFSTNRTKDTRPISNQYVFDAEEYAYISNHYIFADDVQLLTASAGVSYRLDSTLLSADMLYGSGLRSGFANLGHVPAYARFNLGIAQTVHLEPGDKPLTVRFDVVNVFDTIYQLRDGSGIGVEAPQYGARRGFYLGLTKAL